MIYSRDTPIWSGTHDMHNHSHLSSHSSTHTHYLCILMSLDSESRRHTNVHMGLTHETMQLLAFDSCSKLALGSCELPSVPLFVPTFEVTLARPLSRRRWMNKVGPVSVSSGTLQVGGEPRVTSLLTCNTWWHR